MNAHPHPWIRGAFAALLLAGAAHTTPARAVGEGLTPPAITRLTPPSRLFSSGEGTPPYIARFLTGQRFDLQATVQPADGQTIRT